VSRLLQNTVSRFDLRSQSWTVPIRQRRLWQLRGGCAKDTEGSRTDAAGLQRGRAYSRSELKFAIVARSEISLVQHHLLSARFELQPAKWSTWPVCWASKARAFTTKR